METVRILEDRFDQFNGYKNLYFCEIKKKIVF